MIAALPDVLKDRKERDLWREYVAESLRIITENTGRAALEGGRCITVKYADIINPKPPENRTGNEIIEHMKAKLAKIGGE